MLKVCGSGVCSVVPALLAESKAASLSSNYEAQWWQHRGMGLFCCLGNKVSCIIDRTIDFGQHLPILPNTVKVTLLDFNLNLENLSKEDELNMFYSKKKSESSPKRGLMSIFFLAIAQSVWTQAAYQLQPTVSLLNLLR